MQVQSIQSTNMKNNSFKAHFIENKHFKTLWNGATSEGHVSQDLMSLKDLMCLVNCLHRNYKGHALEIESVEESLAYLDYVIFNHKTGKRIVCSVVNDKYHMPQLQALLKELLLYKFDEKERNYFFNEFDQTAKTYQKLTGQKVYFSQKKRKEN